MATCSIRYGPGQGVNLLGLSLFVTRASGEMHSLRTVLGLILELLEHT